MNVLVLGDGLLGSELTKHTGWDYISRENNGFDITDESTYHLLTKLEFDSIEHCSYDVLINCIANTDTYSTDKASHWDTNYKGVARLVDFCNKWNIKLVHISTDYVYTNSVTEACENSVPIHGNNWYSYTKLLADAYIELKSNRFLICRETHKPYPFPYSKAWVDQIGNFDYVNAIAELIIILVIRDITGIYNVGTDLKSVYTLATQTNKDVSPAFCTNMVPKDTTMNLTKLKNTLNREIV